MMFFISVLAAAFALPSHKEDQDFQIKTKCKLKWIEFATILRVKLNSYYFLIARASSSSDPRN